MEVPWNGVFEALLREVLLGLDDREPLTPDMSTAAAGLDSMGAVELLGNLESAFDITISDDQLDLSAFATPGRIWDLVSRLIDPDSAAVAQAGNSSP